LAALLAPQRNYCQQRANSAVGPEIVLLARLSIIRLPHLVSVKTGVAVNFQLVTELPVLPAASAIS